jgi:hypothetical protein
MVHFPGFARTRLWIHRAVRGFCPRGFPHSEIPGSMPACGSPRLIAACHVLHRLLLPRHPPCALSSLTTKFTRHTAACSRRRCAIFQLSSRAKSRELFSFRKTNPQQTTTRRANSMGLDPAHRTPRRFRLADPFPLCHSERSEESAFWLAPHSRFLTRSRRSSRLRTVRNDKAKKKSPSRSTSYVHQQASLRHS